MRTMRGQGRMWWKKRRFAETVAVVREVDDSQVVMKIELGLRTKRKRYLDLKRSLEIAVPEELSRCERLDK